MGRLLEGRPLSHTQISRRIEPLHRGGIEYIAKSRNSNTDISDAEARRRIEEAAKEARKKRENDPYLEYGSRHTHTWGTGTEANTCLECGFRRR